MHSAFRAPVRFVVEHVVSTGVAAAAPASGWHVCCHGAGKPRQHRCAGDGKMEAS